ncbi:hypothetical protein pE33L54_0019 (plasmid) [Bacillus cereus E33L]|uniref:Uncharacterized protein n=2 Tax=Bacillus TaxID=1386 RepID=Q4V0Y2_BACCZ|nr:hypothetical protein pE33L54_0019 [Bacillus cereus E33L]KXO06207.1 hypothetical protein AYK81_00460 [Bacillus thuringiensis]PDZ59273.1 hypothetical protein CON29_24870 [Bacillus thuringiensis]PFS70653.1 hypothetical protein COK50_20875 [Bacillus thuringiensis]
MGVWWGMGKVKELESIIKELEEEIQWRDNHIIEINADNTRVLEQSMEVARLIELYDKFIRKMNLEDELKVFLKEEINSYN